MEQTGGCDAQPLGNNNYDRRTIKMMFMIKSV